MEISAKALSGKDICDIIKTCRRFNVKSFKLDGLEFNFTDEYTLDPSISAPSRESLKFGNSEFSESLVGTAPEPIMAPADLEALEDMETMQLLIDDPAAHETLMIDRNLNQHREMIHEREEIIRT